MWMSAIDIMTSTPAIEIPDFGVFTNAQSEFAQARAAQTEFAQMQEALGSIDTRTNTFTDLNTSNEVKRRPATQ